MADIIRISTFDDPRLEAVARLTENQLVNREDPEHGRFIAETATVIERALDAGYEPLSFIMEEKYADGIGRRLAERCPDVPAFCAPLGILVKLTGYNLTRGLLAEMRRPRLRTVEEICADARRVAVLENVMNPTNVGAIIRSAAALGIDAVLLTNGCSDPLYRRAIRVSVGTVFQVPWTYLPETEVYTDELRRLGFKTVAMALRDDSYSIADTVLKSQEKLAVILGTEGEGLSPDTIASCDYTVKIPMTHGVDSLNVAAASAVAFYELALKS